MKLTTSPMRSAKQQLQEFFSLFPHRFDYIWAEYPDSGERVNWKTESRHPLSDRLLQQHAYLYGVRFGAETQYCLLDIDAGSAYHPRQDPFAISQILAALEPLGLVSYVACTSSYSGGLHLYFPFEHPQSSWRLAIAVTTLIENAGFKVRSGQLEVFPDPKPYRVEGHLSLFNGHRLPLQIGSYLLDTEFQPIWSSEEAFLKQWRNAQHHNDVEATCIRQILKQAKRYHYAVSSKAEKFINDLNAEIEMGWTDFGQTNYLLGRITLREYIFRHILTGGTALEGQALVKAIVKIARSLPGYSDYCRHQHEIEHRAEEWANCIENSHYFHYGDPAGKFKAKLPESKSNNPDLTAAIGAAPNWNQQQSAGARERIRAAVSDLLEKRALPALTTHRYQALLKYGIGGQTLYSHRDLWHPAFLTESITNAQENTGTTTNETEHSSSLLSSDASDSLRVLASSRSLVNSVQSKAVVAPVSSDLSAMSLSLKRMKVLQQMILGIHQLPSIQRQVLVQVIRSWFLLGSSCPSTG